MDVSGQWRYTRGFVRGFISGLRSQRSATPSTPETDDPDILLSLAMQEMRETQAKNRERAVMAISQKNNLQAEVDKIRKMIDNLQAKAELQERSGDSSLAKQLLAERDVYRATLVKMEAKLVSAVQVTEQIKIAMRAEEERIRTKTAQAMALKAEWKQCQILGTLELNGIVDNTTILKPIRSEVQAYLAYAKRLSEELHEMAERALRSGNRTLARALLVERAALWETPAAVS